jgi:hypothetical protein
MNKYFHLLNAKVVRCITITTDDPDFMPQRLHASNGLRKSAWAQRISEDYVRKFWSRDYLYIKIQTMPSPKNKKKKNRYNTFQIAVAIIIILAIIILIVGYFYVDEDKPDVLLVPSTEQSRSDSNTGRESNTAIILGSWVSNYDGAILTLNNASFTLEQSGIDVGSKITGTLAIETNIVTFVYTTGNKACKGAEGHYLYTIEENGEIFFKLIKDPCESRKERMTATWFRL